MTTLCSNASNSKNLKDRSQYLNADFLKQYQNTAPIGNSNINQMNFNLVSASNTGLYSSSVASGAPSSLNGSQHIFGYDNGYGNWIPDSTTFSISETEMCPCATYDSSECDNFTQMGNLEGPYGSNGLDNYRFAFCSSTSDGVYGCTGLFSNLVSGKIEIDPVVFGSMYGVDNLENFDIWRVGQTIPLNPQNLPSGADGTTLDSMQLYFTSPASTPVTPCGNLIDSSNFKSNNVNEYDSFGDIGKVFVYDPELNACSQRVVCPDGICEGDFPRTTPDGPINYYQDNPTHADFTQIDSNIATSKDTDMNNQDGYGNDLFCELYVDSNPGEGTVVTVNRALTQTDTSFNPAMFGNISLYDAGGGGGYVNSPAVCTIPEKTFPNGSYCGLNWKKMVSYNCQVANPQVIPFSKSGSNVDNFNSVPSGYFYWDETNSVGSKASNVGDWSSMQYNGNKVPGAAYTVHSDLVYSDGSPNAYVPRGGPVRTFDMTGAGFNKASMVSQNPNDSSGNNAVRTFCPSFYGPMGAGQKFCGFGGLNNYISGEMTTNNFQQYSNVYNGLDQNCAVNSELYSLSNEFSWNDNNWLPEDMRLYYMALDGYGMDGNKLCELLGGECKDDNTNYYPDVTCVNCLAGNFAYSTEYIHNGGDDAALASANALPWNMRGNMEASQYPGFVDPKNNLPASTSPTVASQLMGCGRQIGYQTTDRGKDMGTRASCSCTSGSWCNCWYTAGDWNGNDCPQIYSDQGDDRSGGESTCWQQCIGQDCGLYVNNINDGKR